MIHDEDEMADVPVRLLNALHKAGITTVEDFLRMSSDDLLALRNVGVGTLARAQEAQRRIQARRNIN